MRIRQFVVFMALASQFILAGNASAAGAVASAYEVDGSSRDYWVGNEATTQAAERLAMANCQAGQQQFKHGKCSISGSADGPNYWVVFRAHNGASGYGASANRELAVLKAYEACAKLGNCIANPAKVWFDAGQPSKTAAAPRAAAAPMRPVIFRTILANGRVSYSDQPQPGSQIAQIIN